VTFTIFATWDDEASAWSGRCDDTPAAANAPMLDLLVGDDFRDGARPLFDNHPGADPSSLYLRIWRYAKPSPPRRAKPSAWRSLSRSCATMRA